MLKDVFNDGSNVCTGDLLSPYSTASFIENPIPLGMKLVYQCGSVCKDLSQLVDICYSCYFGGHTPALPCMFWMVVAPFHNFFHFVVHYCSPDFVACHCCTCLHLLEEY